jgi:hypothetical protein
MTTRTIYPPARNPYYIVAPRYVRTSAGIRALHLLCHSLNSIGQTAYLFIHPYSDPESAVLPDLLTPVVTQEIIDHHHAAGLTPIMVYPEVVSGNPFNAPCVVRYVLNFPGLLGGDKEYPASELCFGYSRVLAEAAKAPDNILFIPVTDTRIFNREDEAQERKGTCFSASKYQDVHNGKLFDVTKDSVEITRDKDGSQTPQEIAALFRRSELFYAYENTALATEAVLCGCPAVFLPNPYLTQVIAIEELGNDGMAWGDAPDEIARARASVGKGAENYMKLYDAYWAQLDRFVELTQAHVRGVPYPAPIHVAEFKVKKFVLNTIGLFFTAWRILKKDGPFMLLYQTGKKIVRVATGEKRPQ